MSNSRCPSGLSGLSEIADDYRFVLCDVWGVVHNGVRAHRPAVEALMHFRAAGRRTVLITNAPRPRSVILEQLDRFAVERSAYEDIVTSGDVARDFLAKRPDARIFHLGPERDLPIYEGLPNPLVNEGSADLVSCTGLFDDRSETPDDYRGQLGRLAGRGLPMLCVNPDRIVERGGDLIWCAGALADVYEALGGRTTMVGKPYAPIYESALGRLAELAGAPVVKDQVLAIGDSAPTDLRGAFDQGIDVLFVTGGIHAAAFGERGATDAAAIRDFLAAADLGARKFMDQLKW